MEQGLQLFVEKVGIPGTIITALVIMWALMQLVGELIELKGKLVPEFMKVRKYFKRKKAEREAKEAFQLELKQLLAEVNSHYSADNIAKRNEWMNWVNERAEVYDASVAELKQLHESITANNELTLDLYINVNRHRILDFANKVVNENNIISREEFNRIFKVHQEYEEVLKKHNKTNGEVTIAYKVIEEAYKERLKNNSFLEDIRGY